VLHDHPVRNEIAGLNCSLALCGQSKFGRFCTIPSGRFSSNVSNPAQNRPPRAVMVDLPVLLAKDPITPALYLVMEQRPTNEGNREGRSMALRRFRNRFRRWLAALADSFMKRSEVLKPTNQDCGSQRMCPFCGLITSRSKRCCLECGKPLGGVT